MSTLRITPSGVQPSVFTWATKPAASAFVGQAFISDVGVNGSTWYSNGTTWIHEAPIVIRTKGQGWLVPSLITGDAATYSQTGTTITVTSTGHAIPNTTFNGYNVYLAIASGNATAGWFTNFTYVDANTFTCTSTVSQSTSGGITTNTAETTVTELSSTIPGGLLGLNGSIRAHLLTENISSGNSKTLRVKLGSSAFMGVSLTTTISNSRIINIYNRGSQSAQVSCGAVNNTGTGNSNGANTTGSIDTSTGQVLSVSLQNSAASEYVAVAGYAAEVMPS